MSDNPFAAPTGAPDADDTPHGTGIAIYSSGVVVGTTFLGSTIAGSLIIVANAVRLGRPLAAPIGYCMAFNTAFFVGAMVLPEFIPNIAYMLGMRQINETLYAEELGLLQLEGGPWAPWWHGLVVALGVLVPLVLLFIGLLVLVGEL